MWSKQSAVATLLLTEIRPEKAAMPSEDAACCEQVVWVSEREVVRVQQKDLVEGGDIGQDKGLELKCEAFQIEREMVAGVGNLPSI